VQFADVMACTTWTVSAIGHLSQHANVGAAIMLALGSTGCYATSAVLQERETSRCDTHGATLLSQLIRRPWWCFAVFATVAGAGLHILALSLGPLSLVQPLGVLTLVFALPLGARLGRRTVTGGETRAAAAVALGLAAVLAVAPHHAPASHLPLRTILAATATLAVVVLLLIGLAERLPRRSAPVVHATAAAACFGFASGMTRIAATGAAAFALPAAIAVLSASAGLGLAQIAYRTGGLGAPLATQILIDPLVAILLAIALLKEPVQLTPIRLSIGIPGLAATTLGIWALTRSAHKPPPIPETARARPDDTR
jgi:hypothetical protein